MDQPELTVGALVEYHNEYGNRRAKIVRITDQRVTLDDGKFFTRRKFGRPWSFDVVPPERLGYETEHATWLAAKPKATLHVSVNYSQRMGVSFQASGTPEAVDEVIAELGKIKTWAAAEPKEPSR